MAPESLSLSPKVKSERMTTVIYESLLTCQAFDTGTSQLRSSSILQDRPDCLSLIEEAREAWRVSDVFKALELVNSRDETSSVGSALGTLLNEAWTFRL